MRLRSPSPPLGGSFKDLPKSEPVRASRPFTGGAQLFDANAARKRAEQDALLLANRIRLLRAEEERTRKKIQDAEKKTSEVLALRRRNEERRRAKEAEHMRREVSNHNLQQCQKHVREDHSKRLQEKQNELREKTNAISRSVRQDQEENNLRFQQQNEELRKNAAKQRAQIRNAHIEAVQNRSKAEVERVEQSRVALEKKLEEEERHLKSKQEEICRMEREEAELILRLQNTHQHHQFVFTQLEDLLHGEPCSRAGSSISSQQPSGGGQRAVGSGSSQLPPKYVSPPNKRAASQQPVKSTPIADQQSTVRRSGSPRLQHAAPQRLPKISQEGNNKAARASLSRGIGDQRSSSVARSLAGRPMIGVADKPSVPVDGVSSCSTRSGGSAEGSPGCTSGRSTPSSTKAPMTYTTVDGVKHSIGAEEEFDLDALLLGC